jgi:hypothetical protein
MITMRSLPPGSMGPAPHRNPHRHDAPVEKPRRLRRAAGALARTARSATTRVRPATTDAVEPIPVIAAEA